MDRLRHDTDALIIGGGPAGIAAACAAAQSGRRAPIVDDNPEAGGQIWRGAKREAASKQAAIWLKRAQDADVRFIRGARVFHQPEAGRLLAETASEVYELAHKKLILATGARERFLPFPGWTLPNVFGAGGLQALVKSGMPIEGKRVVIAGSGPLLLAVAAYLKKRGADILLIAEQARRRRVLGFAISLLGQPEKSAQAMGLKLKLRGVPYLTDCWPVAAMGDGKLSRVTLRRGSLTWSVACDYLACGFHLVANLELAMLLGCEIEDGKARVNEFQETSIKGTFCAGEATGIKGLESAIVEGQIAGYAAAGNLDQARRLFSSRDRLRRFATRLDRAFSLRDELKSLAAAETIVCRCEDVSFERLQEHDSWRLARLQTRCGMGPCQGRVCGPAVEFLFGWETQSARPPVFPARVRSFAHMTRGEIR
ncbi:MAG TPA: FAD/NAD(P)-binding oxidoreductase [Blastocatellia bacterium]|nr:FAD/NAD(P)-binding oxidoreductase [Blastocatellia bacterium]